MKKTIAEQIAANRRSSLILAALMVLLLTALGACIVGIYSPHNWYWGAIGAAALGFIVTLVANTSGPSIVLSLSGAREANHFEDQVLDNVVEEVAIAAGLPKPKIYVIDDDAPNAFATGLTPKEGVIAVTTGLIGKLNRDELQGVVAHEMSHIRNNDVKFMTCLALIAGLIPMLADVLLRMQWFGGGRRNSRDRDDNQLGAIFMIVGLVLSILAPLFAVLLEMAVSRKREFLADASAAELTRYPEGLANALRKISADPVPFSHANRATQHMYIINPRYLRGARGGTSLFDSHPSTEERIRALLGTAGIRRPMP